MSESRAFYDYRLKFSKNGPIRFVGHLDVMRYMQKSNRRAGLPMSYSEGFSPHQILSVALPLSVGATSDGEYLDMRLVQELPTDEILRRLNNAMHEGIEARACILLPEHAPKAMTIIAAARYLLRIREEADHRDALAAYLASSSILVTKKTKKGEQQVDIRPFIHEWTIREDGTLEILLHAGSKNHVKPALLLESFYASIGKEFSPQSLRVHRLDLYEEKDGNFMPLIDESKSSRGDNGPETTAGAQT